jgi:hypothetical protein
LRNGILLISFLAACSSGGGSDGGGISTPSAFDSSLGVASCQNAVKCGFIGASEEKQCETDAAAALKAYPRAYSTGEAVNAKRLAFNGTEAQKCVDANKNNACSINAYFALGDKCANVFKPLVMPGGACKDSGECLGGWCDQGANGVTGCAGTCKANDASGATCDPQGDHCNATDYCDSTTMKCTLRAKLGDACGSNPLCGGNLFCKGYTPADMTNMTPEVKGVCKGVGAAGDACTKYFFGNDDCGDGLLCDDSGTTPTCVKLAVMGGECTSYYGCVDPFDCIGLAFDQNSGAVTTKGKCGPWLDIGKSCPATGESGCPLDSTCDMASSTCKLAGQIGADCDTSGVTASCGTNLYCDGPTAKCAKTVALGGACVAPAMDSMGNPIGGDPCHDGTCTGGTCTLVCM